MADRRRATGEALEALQHALPAWLVTRLAVLLVGYLAVFAIGFQGPPPWTVSDVPVLNLLARWDTGWYLSIAERGYTWPPSAPGGQSEVVFFPLYPMLMGLLGTVLGGRRLLAGWLVSMGACLWALMYFYRLAREHLDQDGAGAALLMLAAYPFAVWYSAAYTESVFLLCVVATVFHAWRGQAVPAAIWGVLAGLARPTGFVLGVVVGLIALAPLLERHATWARRWVVGSLPPRRVGPSFRPALFAAALAPALGLALYSAYIYRLTGNPVAWSSLQAAWGKSNSGFSAIADTLRAIYGLGFARWAARPLDALNELAAAFALLAVWPVLRRFGAGYALVLVLTILPALMSGGVRSLGRYTAPLFPIFLWLGAAVPVRWRGSLVFFFALLQALIAILFFTWRPMM